MKEIDVRAGEMTFGQRIELGRIASNPSMDERQKSVAMLRCLDPGFRLRELRKGLKYLKKALEGLLFWVQQERRLAYTPTEEEKQAGIERIHKATGEMATVMALAKDYGKDPDEILGWKYAKVYGILLTDFERHEFERRLMKVREKKFKSKTDKPWRRK